VKFLKRPQLILIALAVFFIVLLFLLPRVEIPETEIVESEETSSSVDKTADLSAAERMLYDAILNKISSIDNPIEKIDWYDSLSGFWDSRGNVYQAAEALSEIANIIQDKPSYFIAGDKYFEAFQNDVDEVKQLAIKQSIANYQKVLDLNPDDLEAMTSLGVCYVEGAQMMGEAPMKGIGLLKKVLEIDPENINALINLGYFAAKSGQNDIAEQRFKRVLEIDSTYADAYIYLSDLYLNTGRTEKGIEQLEMYKKYLRNPEVIKQLEDYIENIKNK
jgi:tetratricopeptide (TPR) repeat protein